MTVPHPPEDGTAVLPHVPPQPAGRRSRRRLGRFLSAAVAFTVLGSALPAAATAAAPTTEPATEESPAEAPRAQFLGRTHYTGEFHSHTSVSDGVELPDDAFAHVHEETEADFFTLAEHDVMWDIRNGDDFLDDWRDADSAEWRYLHERAEKFNSSQDELVAVPSIENTWYDGTGHINVFDADWHATSRATTKGSVDGFGNSFGTGDLKYDYFTFLARMKQDPDAIGQFNHPSPTSKGNFFGFAGLDPVADDRMELIEIKSEAQIAEFEKALEAGWHLAPVWNGDEHSADWVSGNPSITGVWAAGQDLESLFSAMQDRSLYSTQDVNAVLGFGSGESIMGSILPADTTTLPVDVLLADPDSDDAFSSVRIMTNDGEVAHDFGALTGNTHELSVSLSAEDGDYFYVHAVQEDGNFLVSAPLWIGEKTRGANYAPAIEIADGTPAEAPLGTRITLPGATATDDSGTEPTLAYEVWDSTGQVPVTDNAFTVRGYDDHFVVVKATDDLGNTNAEMLRITVSQDDLDPVAVYERFPSTVTVGEVPGTAGLSVTTDRSIDTAYAQVLPEGQTDWSAAEVLAPTTSSPYEWNTIGNDEPEYQHSITGQTLRSHDFDLQDLEVGTRYQYRFGVGDAAARPAATDPGAWTEVRGTFLAGGAEAEPVYVLGDLQVPDRDPASLDLIGGVLDTLKEKKPGGGTAVQVGDLVDNGGRGEQWTDVHEHFLSGLDLQLSPLVGNHETYGDPDYDVVGNEPGAIFRNVFNTPDNGAIGETNYSYDRGDIHFSVLNSNVRLEEQLKWLVEDVRASDATWHVVLGHFSYYGGSHADDGGMDVARDRVTRTLDQLGVDLYVGGHDHVYKRSTIENGELALTEDEKVGGTTFVTMGSSGPKFYDNQEFAWDDVVFDEDTQMGGVIEASESGLTMSTYTIDGREVDSFTVTKPEGEWEVSSAEIADREMEGVGLRSYPGAREDLTVIAATYDNARSTMTDVRTVDVALDHSGREQFTRFESPLPVPPSATVELFVWDSLSSGKSLAPAQVLREGLDGEGTAEDPYLLDSKDDLAKVDNDPSGHYRLTADIDASGADRTQIGAQATFTGTLDGAGHTISGLEALHGSGSGLVVDNHGTIRNLVVSGDVTTDRGTVGFVSDSNHGLIERVRVDGQLTAKNYVGGVTGHQFGTVQDVVSTVDVTATEQYVGGVTGVSVGGSTTERTLATGAVTSAGPSAGGIAAYGYTDTRVRNNVALNSSVSGTGHTHAILGRVYAGQTATLENNHVSEDVPVIGESVTAAPAPDNQRGGVVPVEEIRAQGFYEGLGWDFTEVWQWNDIGQRPTLQVAPEELAAPPAPELEQDAEGFYLVGSAADLAQIDSFPHADYRLTADLDLTGTEPITAPFSGEFDGAGYTLSGFASSTGGLFSLVTGSVHDLVLEGAQVDTTRGNIGSLVDRLEGSLERVSASGSVTAASTAGGVVGYSCGVVRDVRAEVTVSANAGRQAGGVLGIAGGAAQCGGTGGSLTERVLATGAVEVVDNANAGGVAGYSYTGTTVRNAIALNPTVTGTSYAHRVVARTLANNTATFENLLASEAVVAGRQSITATGPTTHNGETLTAAEAAGEATFSDRLGFDLGNVWQWDAGRGLPVLSFETPSEVPAPETTESAEPTAPVPTTESGEPTEVPTEAPTTEPTEAPTTEPAESAESTAPVEPAVTEPAVAGGVVVGDAADASADGSTATTGLAYTATADDAGTVSLEVTGGAAGEAATVLVLREGADASAPTEEDLLHVGEAVLDESGAHRFTFVLPADEAATAHLALAVSGDAPRLTGPLFGAADGPEWTTELPVITTEHRKGVKPGALLEVDPGVWSPVPGFTYQWLADGEPIAGATGETYRLTGAHKRAEISVAVTGTAEGYAPITVESEPVRAA